MGSVSTHTFRRAKSSHTEGPGLESRKVAPYAWNWSVAAGESESPRPLLVGGLRRLPSLSLVSSSVKRGQNMEHTVIQILLNFFNCPIEA